MPWENPIGPTSGARSNGSSPAVRDRRLSPAERDEKAPRRPARILLSGHFIFSGRVGGAEHMVYNLARGLIQGGAQVDLLASRRSNLSNDFVAESAACGISIVECGGAGPRFLSEQCACFDRRIAGDAILFPNYFLPPLIAGRLRPAGVVIHDFQYRHFPWHFSARKRAWLRLAHRHALMRADTVIAISEFVRQDAIRFYGRSANRIKVIPNPVSWDRFGPERGAHPYGKRPYVLSVAAQYPHKGLDLLVRAFAQVSAKRPELLLVLCGQLPDHLVSVGVDRTGLKRIIGELNLADRVRMTGYIDDRTLGDHYHHAAAFAFPSVFEGFGMPAVEALGFGVPTLTTRCAALPESTLGLATFVDDPRDVGECAARLAELVDAPRLPPARIAEIRRHYAPATIGKRYLEALTEGRFGSPEA